MNPLTRDIPKALLNVGGKTLLDWTIERLSSSGIHKIIVAVGWKGNEIEDYLLSSSIDVEIIEVSNYEIGPLQTLTAAIEKFDDDFLLTPVDTWIEASIVQDILSFHSQFEGHPGMTLAVDTQANFGTFVSLENDNLITGLAKRGSESDVVARSAMMFIGNSKILERCRSALEKGHTRFVSVLDEMVKDGHRLRAYQVQSSHIDIDTIPDLLDTNRKVLEKGGLSSPSQIYVPKGDSIEVGDAFSTDAEIRIQKGVEILGPVIISPGCNIGEDCRIGPNTTLDSNSVLLTGCDISNSIVFGDSTIPDQSRVQQMVVYKSKLYSSK